MAKLSYAVEAEAELLTLLVEAEDSARELRSAIITVHQAQTKAERRTTLLQAQELAHHLAAELYDALGKQVKLDYGITD